MKEDGFTLIEVIVVMAIIASLVGIMVPFFYRVWESNEVDLTKQRMSDLQKAMVGDPRLIQNGVRTNFGYVGDYGQLPATLNDLITYMPAGFNPQTYEQDAWGHTIVYTAATVSGKRVSATLQSAGPDGKMNTADDINATTDPELQVYQGQVAPTAVVQGNINITINYAVANPPLSPAYNQTFSASVAAQYLDPSGTVTDTTHCCVNFNSGDVTASVTNNYSVAVNCAMGENLPVGKALFWSQLFLAAGCVGSPIASLQTALFVVDGLNSINVNLPTNSYTVTVQ
ncbi:MAG: prepilin-type N-terminal cleavage/methylation domain-containing protein [Thermodesulfovibrionales bacterium]|jgi:prepilin-type N-terminal cleavage/methylation domain-containing protein